MTQQIYTVRDTKSEEHLGLMLFKTKAEAQRNFETLLNNAPRIKDHPEDYQLYHVGAFDTESGVITPAIPSDHTDYNPKLEA